MIFFGTRGVKSTLSQGQFNCPQCEANRDYKHKKVTRFFTLYFIPIIPLGKLGDFVECQSCKGTFVSKVLDYNKDAASDAFLAEYEKAMKHCMVLIMLADGEIDDNEMVAVQAIINKFSHNDVTLDQLEEYVDEVKAKSENISTYLRGVTPSLNEHGKEIIIKCALSVAAADGNIDASELNLIKEMATTMEMSGSHLKGILSELSETKHTQYSDN